MGLNSLETILTNVFNNCDYFAKSKGNKNGFVQSCNVNYNTVIKYCIKYTWDFITTNLSVVQSEEKIKKKIRSLAILIHNPHFYMCVVTMAPPASYDKWHLKPSKSSIKSQYLQF